MTSAPQTRYTRATDGTNLAYQVSGDGPLDLMILGGAPIPIDLVCEDPGFIRMARRLGAFSRTIWFEARGAGASEGNFQDGLVDEVFDADLIAVLDAVGCERVGLVGRAGAGASAIHFSVTHPDRVSALVLINSFAHYVQDDDHPWGIPPDSLDDYVATVEQTWGTGAALVVLAPDSYADERFRAWWARAQRLGVGPDQMAKVVRAGFERDVRALLPSVSVPTLVLHREGDGYIDVGAGRYLAERIPGAKLVVLPGNDHLFFLGDTDAVVDEIEEFLTGIRRGAEGDAMLAAVLFTDIVASTAQQARLGPREWSRLTDRHDALVRAALTRHRGHEVKTLGDGFLATFDATGRALRCAAEILVAAKDIGLELRAGLHTGEVEVRGEDIAGLVVTIARRICDLADSGQVLVSESVRSHMVGMDLAFQDRGNHELKGLPGTWRLYALET